MVVAAFQWALQLAHSQAVVDAAEARQNPGAKISPDFRAVWQRFGSLLTCGLLVTVLAFLPAFLGGFAGGFAAGFAIATGAPKAVSIALLVVGVTIGYAVSIKVFLDLALAPSFVMDDRSAMQSLSASRVAIKGSRLWLLWLLLLVYLFFLPFAVMHVWAILHPHSSVSLSVSVVALVLASFVAPASSVVAPMVHRALQSGTTAEYETLVNMSHDPDEATQPV